MAVHFAIFAVLSERTHRDGRTDRRCWRHCGDTATPALPFRDNESLHFLDWSFAETETWDQTAQLWSETGVEFNQSPRVSSLTSSATRRWFRRIFVYLSISEKLKWFSLIKTYLVHAKSAGELISFECSDRRSVWSLVSAKRSANRWVQTKKNDFTFWLLFGLSSNLGLSRSLSERLIQKVKWPNDSPKISNYSVLYKQP